LTSNLIDTSRHPIVGDILSGLSTDQMKEQEDELIENVSNGFKTLGRTFGHEGKNFNIKFNELIRDVVDPIYICWYTFAGFFDKGESFDEAIKLLNKRHVFEWISDKTIGSLDEFKRLVMAEHNFFAGFYILTSWAQDRWANISTKSNITHSLYFFSKFLFVVLWDFLTRLSVTKPLLTGFFPTLFFPLL
jgi:hypothetical protein